VPPRESRRYAPPACAPRRAWLGRFAGFDAMVAASGTHRQAALPHVAGLAGAERRASRAVVGVGEGRKLGDSGVDPCRGWDVVVDASEPVCGQRMHAGAPRLRVGEEECAVVARRRRRGAAAVHGRVLAKGVVGEGDARDVGQMFIDRPLGINRRGGDERRRPVAALVVPRRCLLTRQAFGQADLSCAQTVLGSREPVARASVGIDLPSVAIERVADLVADDGPKRAEVGRRGLGRVEVGARSTRGSGPESSCATIRSCRRAWAASRLTR